MARPTPTSAAATAMMNSAKTAPVALCSCVPKATRLRFTALRMSSMDMSTITPFRRASTPYTPMANSAAARKRNWLRNIGLPSSVPPGQDDGADEGGEQHDRGDLEGDQVGAEDRVAHLLGGLPELGGGLADDLDAGAPPLVPQGPAHGEQEQQADDAADDLLGGAVVEVVAGAELGPGQHDAEQEQHDDGADVDEHLADGHELGGQQDVLGGHAGEHDDQVEGGVHDVLGGDDAQGGADHHQGEDPEGEVHGKSRAGFH